MAEHQAARRILVGVTYGQSDVVLRHAARFARTFDAALVCAHVDPGRYVVEELPDGTVASSRSIRTYPNSRTPTSIKGWWPRSGQRSLMTPSNCRFESWQATSRTRSPGWPTSSMSR